MTISYQLLDLTLPCAVATQKRIYHGFTRHTGWLNVAHSAVVITLQVLRGASISARTHKYGHATHNGTQRYECGTRSRVRSSHVLETDGTKYFCPILLRHSNNQLSAYIHDVAPPLPLPPFTDINQSIWGGTLTSSTEDLKAHYIQKMHRLNPPRTSYFYNSRLGHLYTPISLSPSFRTSHWSTAKMSFQY